MSGHAMTVDWSGNYRTTYKVTCNEPDEAICRARWDCGCEYFADHGVNGLGPWHELADGYMTHEDRVAAEAGDPPRHYGKPGGECGIALWINESDCADELGNGPATFPIEARWDGDDYTWIPLVDAGVSR